MAASVAALLDKPDAFTGKQVKTRGKVEKFRSKVSQMGKPYFTFKLVEKEKRVSVFGRGKLEKELKDGATVEVVGTFRMEIKVGGNVFKNEIETAPKQVKVLDSKS